MPAFARNSLMPLYVFEDQLSNSSTSHEFRDYDVAWSQLIMMCGEMLKEIDGALAHDGNWLSVVTEGETGRCDHDFNAPISNIAVCRLMHAPLSAAIKPYAQASVIK